MQVFGSRSGKANKVLEVTALRVRARRGLVELIDAQRTQDDVYLSYVAALAANAKALVTLERASAIWGIDF